MGTYTYDGNSLRVKKVSGSTTTVYIFSGSKVIAEYSGTSTPYPLAREYIYSGGALLAKIESGATKYYHPDHLSNRVVTDSSGTVVAQLGHYPFGESWYNASGDKLLFTSYERDSESSNDYAMLRFHINRLGRFSSPDRLSGSIGDPQSLNRYFYAASDPVNLVDPSGMFIVIAPSPDPFGGPPDPWGWPPVGGGGGPILTLGCSYSHEPDDFGNYGIDCSDSGPLQRGGHGGGGRTVKSVKNDLYANFQDKLNKCIKMTFGPAAAGVPRQTLDNAPILNAKLNSQQVAAMSSPPEPSGTGANNPNLGPNGTVYVSNELWTSSSPRASEFINRTFVHELGNILDERLNPNVPAGKYGRTYGTTANQTGDTDTGQALEDCVLGPYNPHGGA